MAIGTRLFRSALLAMAGNRAAEALALKYGLRLGARQFVAGETREEALDKVRDLNRKGIEATLDHLGEGIRRMSEAEAYKQEYVRLLEGIRAAGVRSNVSLKPTQMGLALDPDAAYANIREIVAAADRCGNFVRIDMEDSPHTDATIGIARRLHGKGLTNVGTVIQAYLYRSEDDIRRLTAEPMNLRLVKGAYKEPKSLAYPRKPDVDANFRRLAKARLRSGVYTAIATHDETIIRELRLFARREGIDGSAYEFQMLYGIRSALQEQLAAEGCRVRCYVPYGRMWYPYFVRRLAERPANAAFLIRNWIRG
ncbi:proline dehydrogenase family protein [Cohnella nanjingensis]|uniref:proline dehydrogenase n=1 Tax=Cohnella nanjingensis TaxID=1387779 RepID=A0A7X0VD94_9BACL|nr:proline dehydrogenase family protein [Cohnella nanjingensis]MBB6669742.1 proline dehydrogenase family protein [Cohnella nanjingensis]